ncbi:MAG: thiamine pyrophosphate-dependent dehydrogenase E1 component subunit alpha [Terriglobia bacterium]
MNDPSKLSAETRKALYRQMLRIRKFEETTHELYKAGALTGMSPHLYIGEEASAVGVISLLNDDDYILSTHRGHGHCLAKGAEMGKMYAELFGKESGYCHGRGGSMHIADVPKGNLGANGIVGGGCPIALGAGFTIRRRKSRQVVICFFGDAATNQGTFHEAANMSKAFQLPIVWVCENNLYGLSTPITKVSATPDLSDRARGYGMPGATVDGMDVEAVRAVAEEVINRARSGGGPSLLEVRTYRYFGHGASDHRPYRTREEEQGWWKRCPVASYRSRLLEEGAATEEELATLEKEIAAEVEAGVAFARSSPDPKAEESSRYVYTED